MEHTYYQVLAQVINSLSGIVHQGVPQLLYLVVHMLRHCLTCHSIVQWQHRMQLVQLAPQLPAKQASINEAPA